jgi:NinB protein
VADQTFILISKAVVSNASTLLHNLPTDGSMEAVFRKVRKIRTPDHNSAMWSGPLRDIEQQAWVKGRQFQADVWHEYFKLEYLPEGDEEDIESLVKAGYRKWDYTPKGDRVLVGSTTQLTTKGMAQYLTKIEAYAQQELGVQLSANPARNGMR